MSDRDAPVPQADPRANYLAHASEIDSAISAVLRRGRYILGPEVAAFEREFGDYLGGAAAIGVASGTDALHIALRACGVGPGDGVITVSNTAVATIAAIELAGATPWLADVSPDGLTLDVSRLEEELPRVAEARLKAILAVHLYGRPADMPAILRIARRRRLFVIEDCAQSHGAAIEGRRTGTWGDIAAFSFYPTKNLGALGDGGAVVTGDAQLERKARLLREYGWKDRYVSEIAGMNSRLDELQAAVLRVKLRYLDAENDRRRRIASRYSELLKGTDALLPAACAGHVFHQYVIRTDRRDALREALARRRIGTAIHYPVPVHLQPAYLDRTPQLGPLRVTEAEAGRILSLPAFPELDDRQVEIVAAAVKEELAGGLPGPGTTRDVRG